ncbi:MAG: isoprenyl transferase [Paludibacter sp.]|nr:isoprenyl transferase [Paludibacter sp.]
MSENELIDKERIPQHVAIIMDGNGRWAENKGKKRTFGHECGVDSVRMIVEVASEIGINYLTLYTFSTENWKRTEAEIQALMSILISSISTELEPLKKNNVRLLTIGDATSLPVTVQKMLNHAIKATSQSTGLSLVLALNYGSKQDITSAARKICQDIENKKIVLSDITDNVFSKYLSTANIPDPELLIRTGGEYRISNFLLWEIAYTELYFTKTLWPDFDKDEFYKAIHNYQTRETRYGKTSEQLAKLKN